MGARISTTAKLSRFQKNKLLHEFHTFFDLNKNGTLEWKDFDMARTRICQLSGWAPGTDKYLHTQELFIDIWRRLQDDGDYNLDGKISAEEWLTMWERFHERLKEKKEKRKQETEEEEETPIPDWLNRYIEYKFNLYDRTGDGIIDLDEYEYVLSDFGVSPKDARACFVIFSSNGEHKIDMAYFRTLCAQYYLSDQPSSLGNFLTGRLDFYDDPDPEVKVTPEAVP